MSRKPRPEDCIMLQDEIPLHLASVEAGVSFQRIARGHPSCPAGFAVEVRPNDAPWLTILDESDPLCRLPAIVIRAVSDRIRSLARGSAHLPACQVSIKSDGRTADVEALAAWILWLVCELQP